MRGTGIRVQTLVVATQTWDLTPEQASQYSITVAPNSLVGMDGQKMAGGQVGFSAVAPELVRGMLPQGVSQLATTLGYRAQAGAKILYDFLTEAMAPRETGSLADDSDKSPTANSSPQQASQSTLTPADLSPPWRGPAVRKQAGHSA